MEVEPLVSKQMHHLIPRSRLGVVSLDQDTSEALLRQRLLCSTHHLEFCPIHIDLDMIRRGKAEPLDQLVEPIGQDPLRPNGRKRVPLVVERRPQRVEGPPGSSVW